MLLQCTVTIWQDSAEPDGAVRRLSPSPQISIDISSGKCDLHSSSTGANTQHAKIAEIAKIVTEKDLGSLLKFGGVEGIADALGIDLENGILGDAQDLQLRRFASQISQTESAPATFFHCLLKACNSYMILLLLVSMVLSLCYGINKEGGETGWYEGFVILVAIIILVLCHSIRDFWHRNRHKMSTKELLEMPEALDVQVFRGGRQLELSISDLVMGDIIVLRRGYQVPADGLYVSGEVLELDDCLGFVHSQNPFMFYGARVISGNGRMLVTSAGINTEWRKRMSKVMLGPNKTPLQSQLDKLYTRAEIIGILTSIFILVELFLRLTLKKDDDNPGLPPLKGKPLTFKDLEGVVEKIVVKPTGKINLFTTSLNMLLVMSEGYPLVMTLSLAYWNKKTLSGKAFAQRLLACATMGSITTICTEKIGGLTLSPVQVKMWRIGEEDINDDSVIDSDVLDALCDGIYTLVLDPRDGYSPEEEGVLSWAASNLGMKEDLLKQNCTLVEAKELDSIEERSLVLMRKNPQNETVTCLHWKGPATTILARCLFYYDRKGRINDMTREKRIDFENFIQQMQSKHLKTIAFAYKKIDGSSEENNLILIGVLGLKDIDWRETKEAVEACRNGGVSVIIVSRENIQGLRGIADKFGLVDSNSLVLDCKEFRSYTEEQRMKKVDQISIMSNAGPSDKLLLLESLKQSGHSVAFIGGRTDETPAINLADVGVAMGTWSTKMARGASDIVILDGDFSFLETIIRHGRCACENIQKYIQFELTMVIAGLLISSTATGLHGDAPFSAIQVAFGTAIVSILGGLALLTEPPAEKLIGKQPVRPGGQLINRAMFRNIITQATYQVTILVTIQSKGSDEIHWISSMVDKSLVFNSFVLCQVFNIFNCRKLEKNIFKGINKNHWFWVAVVVTMGLQASFIEIEHRFGGNARLNYEQWGICCLIGIVSWVLDCIGKFASDLITHCFGWIRGSLSRRYSLI